mmetsp:Transcript_12116/g.26901  ORF Transcript_12116/g.26901 Transcript_12116/m.26901 type:complete len:212 (+) Transcript_12116:1745-2380(+)
MVTLILRGQAHEDLQGLLLSGLRHGHGLEAALQSGVLLDVLPVLVHRRGPNALELSSRQSWLEEIRRVHAAALSTTAATSSHESVHLVDDKDHAALTRSDFPHHCSEALLEVAAVPGACQQQGEVELNDDLLPEAHRNPTLGDALSKSVSDGGLADSSLSDEHRVVLRAPSQDPNCAPQLLLAAYEWLKLPFSGHSREVLTELEGVREIYL